MPAN
jgi:MFS family permease